VPAGVDLTGHVPPILDDRKIVAFYSYKGGVGRTMALCNVATWLARRHAATASPHLRIVCVDLDVDAPGVGVFLPPPGGTECIGILGLIRQLAKEGDLPFDWSPGRSTKEYARHHFIPEPPEAARARTARLQAKLTSLLDPDGEASAQYMYAVPETPNLYVMPVGSPADEERADAVRLLRELLRIDHDDVRSHDAPAPLPEGQPADESPPGLFTLVKRVLRAHFTYTLVDTRTGLADIAFGTMSVLADSLVMVFRPNATQLLAAQQMLAEFLFARGITADREDVPVIPVLSPRPAFFDPRVRSLRDVAKRQIFKWLPFRADGYGEQLLEASASPEAVLSAPAADDIIELPFDLSLQVGERLIVELQPSVDEDAEAPLYKAYASLAGAIQRGNARNDPDGARALEEEALRADRYGDGLRFRLNIIASRPDVATEWGLLIDRYGEYLAENARSRRLVWEMCDAAAVGDDAHSTVRCLADLVASEIAENDAPSIAAARLRRAFDALPRLHDRSLVRMVLIRLTRHFDAPGAQGLGVAETGPRAAESDRLPSYVTAAEALAELDLVAARQTRETIREALAHLEQAYSAPEYSERLVAVLHDQLRIAADAGQQALVLRDYVRTLLLEAQFERAQAVLEEGATFRDVTDDVRLDLLEFILRIGSDEQRSAPLRERIAPADSRRFEARWALTRGAAAMRANLARLADAATYTGPDDLTEAYVLAAAKSDAGDAAALEWLTRRAAAVQAAGEDGMQTRALREILRWLGDAAHPDPAVAAWARKTMARDMGDGAAGLATIVALCVEPELVVARAEKALGRSQWPLVAFGWRVLACATPDGAGRHADEVRRDLQRHPLFAVHFRNDPAFPMLRRVADRLGGRPDSLAAILERIAAQEHVEPSAAWGSEPAIPRRILTDTDPELEEIAERWRGELAHVRSDPQIGRLLTTVLRTSDEYAGEARGPVPVAAR
jgi:Mrp family chromosome partitioning ATPase